MQLVVIIVVGGGGGGALLPSAVELGAVLGFGDEIGILKACQIFQSKTKRM